ncbi:MAG: CARDB domain-containing protein [Sedimentisphaeraceae bacterium JB056]
MIKKSILFISAVLLTGLLLSTSGCYSCKSYHKMKGDGSVEPAAADKFFWDKECKLMPQEETTEPAPPKGSTCGTCDAMQAYPGNSCGIVKIDKSMPVEVQLNEPFDYTIHAKNMTSGDLIDVVITEHLGNNFKYAGSTPDAKQKGTTLVWKIDKLGPEEMKEMTISGSAVSTECIQNCTTVDYVIPTCAYVKVVQPKLMLTKEAPDKAVICDEIPMKFTITNNGTGNATNVMITDQLPEGLMTLDGKDMVSINVGTLMAGKSQLYTVNTKAEETGTYENKAYATAGGGLKAESEMTTTTVTQPILEITKEGPETRYLGRSVQYTIKVTNNGDEVAENTMISDMIPANVTDIVLSDGGSVEGNKAMWPIGPLAPEASKTVTISYMPSQSGKFTNKASVTAICAKSVVAQATTEVKGIPALLLEVIDISDPIEVGNNETYNIIVTNQGTATATNVMIKAILEDTMQYVSTSGATRAQIDGETISFAALPTLAPKAKASWNVTVKAVGEGDVRFSVKLNSDQLDRDVEETESTHFYK